MRTAADTDVMWQEIIIQSVILHTLTSRINASTRCWHITLSLEWCFSEVTFTVIYTLCEKGLLLLSNTAVCYLFSIYRGDVCGGACCIQDFIFRLPSCNIMYFD